MKEEESFVFCKETYEVLCKVECKASKVDQERETITPPVV